MAMFRSGLVPFFVARPHLYRLRGVDYPAQYSACIHAKQTQLQYDDTGVDALLTRVRYVISGIDQTEALKGLGSLHDW